MLDIAAEIIKHSSYNGDEIITIKLNYPRFILAQINTSRMLSKNTASSRAVPTKSLLEMDIFIPEHVGINKSGMESTEYLSGKDLKRFQKLWTNLYSKVAKDVIKMQDELNVHKQTVNRLLEPFLYSTSVLTGTRESWEHLIALRIHHSTQPEYQILAQKIQEAISNSIPQKLISGAWHLPYVDSTEPGENFENVKISVSCSAQISYRKLNDSKEKALEIYDKLNLVSKDPKNPPHSSPAMHQVLAVNPELLKTQPWYKSEMGDNFVQYWKLLEFENQVKKEKNK